MNVGVDYKPEIDGLRALAVVAVIINHFDQDILPGGFLGVDIFFVISGYVITSAIYRNPSKSLADLLLSFYARRVKRIVPALVLCIVTTSIIICFFNPYPTDSLVTGISALAGASNVYLWLQSMNYFGTSAWLNVFTHTWSLGVEEQFYVFFLSLSGLRGSGEGATPVEGHCSGSQAFSRLARC